MIAGGSGVGASVFVGLLTPAIVRRSNESKEYNYWTAAAD